MSLLETIQNHLGWCWNKDSPELKIEMKADIPTLTALADRRELPRRILTFVMIILLPLVPALMYVGYHLMIPDLLPSGEFQMTVRILIIGIPAALLIYYGHRTGNRITSTLSGALLAPLFLRYSEILLEVFDPDQFMSQPGHWLNWHFFINITPFVLILGLMGYFASRRTNLPLFIAVILAILVIIIMLGID